VIQIIFIFLLLVILILLSFTYAKIIITVHRVNEDDFISIKLELLFGLIKLKFKIPYIDIVFNRLFKPGIKLKTSLDTKKKAGILKSKSIFGTGDFKEAYRKIKRTFLMYENVFKYIFSKTRIDSLRCHTEVGLDDAALTAVAAGVIWAIKSNLICIIAKKIVPENIVLDVHTSYSKIIFEIDLHCIIRIRIANIIIAGTKVLYLFCVNAIFKKGGEGNERTSYSRVNEDYNG